MGLCGLVYRVVRVSRVSLSTLLWLAGTPSRPLREGVCSSHLTEISALFFPLYQGSGRMAYDTSARVFGCIGPIRLTHTPNFHQPGQKFDRPILTPLAPLDYRTGRSTSTLHVASKGLGLSGRTGFELLIQARGLNSLNCAMQLSTVLEYEYSKLPQQPREYRYHTPRDAFAKVRAYSAGVNKKLTCSPTFPWACQHDTTRVPVLCSSTVDLAC
ncbi:hypothetical protein HOY82DRAFT_565434 [Tuber indicum]|nr:hypothetical protein HOY82DRAFT_565434 [Tuber indicum]